MSGNRVEIDVAGIDGLNRALAANVAGLADALRTALFDANNDIATESQNLVPFEFGDLKGSMAQNERSRPGSVEFEIVYGTPYALIQHERLDYFHPGQARGGIGPTSPGTPGGSPKYLEFPFVQETSRWPGRLVQRVRAHFHFVMSDGR